MFLKLLPICLLLAARLALGQQQAIDFHEAETVDNARTRLYNIEGRVLPPEVEMQVSAQFPIDVTLSINGGEYLGFVRTNGKFIISAVPSGSYVLNVNHADLHFAPLRIEISQSGQYRARTLNHLRPAKVIRLTYPLELKPLQRRKYFLDREQWNIMDYLLNPMTLLMVVPLVLMLLLPLLIRDPETQREIENMQLLQIPPTMPDLTDMLTSYLANKRSPEKKKQPAIAEKPQKKKH